MTPLTYWQRPMKVYIGECGGMNDDCIFWLIRIYTRILRVLLHPVCPADGFWPPLSLRVHVDMVS